MKTALSLYKPEEWVNAERLGADYREVRLDLVENEKEGLDLLNLCQQYLGDIETIVTVRSFEEGGKFRGSVSDYHLTIKPWLITKCQYIDLEEKYSMLAPEIRSYGKKIIASIHMNTMPSYDELFEIEKRLKKYGNIVKIVVAPRNMTDAADLIKFTTLAQKPIITSIMGEEFRVVRIPLLIAGSMLMYCCFEKCTSKGQYGITEIKQLIEILNN